MSFSKRRVLIAFTAGSILLAALPPPADATAVSGRFTDDDGHPGEVHLDWLAELGVVRLAQGGLGGERDFGLGFWEACLVKFELRQHA